MIECILIYSFLSRLSQSFDLSSVSNMTWLKLRHWVRGVVFGRAQRFFFWVSVFNTSVFTHPVKLTSPAGIIPPPTHIPTLLQQEGLETPKYEDAGRVKSVWINNKNLFKTSDRIQDVEKQKVNWKKVNILSKFLGWKQLT